MNDADELITGDMSDKDIEKYYAKRLLPLFELPSGKLTWHGESGFDYSTGLYYFSLDEQEYIIVHEVYAEDDEYSGAGLIGDAVAPHQRLTHISPKIGSLPYVRIEGENGKVIPYMTGYFSIFRITG